MLTRRTFLQLVGASTGAAITGSEFLSQAGANAAPALSPQGSNGIEHVVVLMMENRSFDHFLSWLPGANGRGGMAYLATDGNVYPNYPLAPDFQGCGYSDPDHSWEGWLVEYNCLTPNRRGRIPHFSRGWRHAERPVLGTVPRIWRSTSRYIPVWLANVVGPHGKGTARAPHAQAMTSP